jgi:hypothetical protein|tara:strand:+ start:489 stop:713 length:225 start_codon:yes stop_codon:yes gene_type:complete
MKDRKLINLQSTVNQQGETVSQVIHFKGGIKRTYHGILSETIKQGQFTKMKLLDGSMLMVNDNNVLCIEVYKED